MSEEKKYVTFRDLRAVTPAQKTTSEPDTPTSISSSPSSTSTSHVPRISNKTKTVDAEFSVDLSSPSVSSSSSSPSVSSTSSIASGESRLQQEAQQKRRIPSVAPESDFQRVPNSVTRRAIPEGLFRGKSKQVWDYLWSVTRGAIVPVRSIRKSRREIKAGSGLGSMVTVDAALEHLQNVGLIAVKPAIGSLTGNEYEVFTPEESSTSTSSRASSTRVTQKVDELDIPQSGISSITQVIENTGSWEPSNTSFKTKDINTDDEAFAGFAEAARKTVIEVTGKEPSKAEATRWTEVAEVLMTELKIAAGRTTISSVPAFLAEHLRRRLWKKEKRQIEAEAAEQKASAPAKKVDASHCPDCSGTGMYYPEGFDKGVARCTHSKLVTESEG
jgi:hypothetical protein